MTMTMTGAARPLGFAHLHHSTSTSTTSWRSSRSSVGNNRCRHRHADTTFNWKNASATRSQSGTILSCWALQRQRRRDDDIGIDIDVPTVTTTNMYSSSKPTTISTTPTTTSATTTVKSQAALIAGTAIGGGFLALPAATAPCGAGPAALGLCGVWLFLLGGSLSLSNAIFCMKRRRERRRTCALPNEVVDGVRDDDDDDTSKSQTTFTPSSLSSLIRECYGQTAGMITGMAFLSLIMLTLVAQLSKVGSLVGNAFPLIDVRFTTTCFTISMIALCSFCTGRRVERINTVLTGVMLGSFVSLVGLAAGSGRWSLDALKRADYTLLLPTFLASSSSAPASSIGSCSPWAIPIFIQLLVYNEVVPLVASRLQDEAKVRKAIVLGSLAPLLMCLIWSCVSLGLVPYEPPILTASPGKMMYTYDPLNKLLGASSMAGIIGKLFSVSVNVLAGSAICTTIIGCILASALFIEDTLQCSTTKVTTRRSNVGAANRMTENIYRKIGTRALAIVPSAIVALCGTKRDLYYRAIRLAGAGPVTLLYGLLPPLCNLRLCWKNGSRDNEGGFVRHRIHVATQLMLVMISLAILTASHVSR